jgi:hypothetical protein
MTSRRRRFLLGAGLLALLGVAIWTMLPRPGISKANFDRLRQGMTQEDVEVVLGPPSGTSPSRPIPGYAEMAYRTWHGGGKEKRTFCWEGGSRTIIVGFQASGQVCWAVWYAVPPGGTPFDRLRRLLPW